MKIFLNLCFEVVIAALVIIQQFPILCNTVFLLTPLLASLSALRMYLIAAGSAVYLTPEVTRGNSLLLNLEWFLMRIIAADFCFYVSHWLFHRKFLHKIHLKHHEFADLAI